MIDFHCCARATPLPPAFDAAIAADEVSATKMPMLIAAATMPAAYYAILILMLHDSLRHTMPRYTAVLFFHYFMPRHHSFYALTMLAL